MIDAAIAGGVPHFYPSESGSDLSHLVALKQRYFRDKQITRRHLEKVAKENDRFTYTYKYATYPISGFDRDERSIEFF